jgi:hypothetical protein
VGYRERREEEEEESLKEEEGEFNRHARLPGT